MSFSVASPFFLTVWYSSLYLIYWFASAFQLPDKLNSANLLYDVPSAIPVMCVPSAPYYFPIDLLFPSLSSAFSDRNEPFPTDAPESELSMV